LFSGTDQHGCIIDKGNFMTRLPTYTPPPMIKKIHFIAICGTAMGALACMLRELGYTVTGSDQHVYPPMSDFLNSKGISIFSGYDPRNLEQEPDMVIVGNAISRDNPEVLAMYEKALPYCSMPQAINHFAAKGKRQIVVTGTHGKTTTASFIAWLLETAGLDPSFLIGGIVTNFNSNYRVGKGDWIVLEGDEYDTAFFDKGPKFLHYQPNAAVLTSIEFDHADIFSDLNAIKEAFGRLISGLAADALLLAFDKDRNVDELSLKAPCRVMRYGHNSNSAWRLGKVTISPPWVHFDVLHHGQLYSKFKTRMIGEHNMRNLLSGIALGDHLNIGMDSIMKAVETFQGTRRRQEIRGEKNNILVLDDFAHHPTAVKETIQAVKSFYGKRRLIAVFEPRTNSSRRKVFQSIYPASFFHADLICIRQPPLMDKIPVDQRFSSETLVRDLNELGKEAYFFPDTNAILEFLSKQVRPLDVILIMSNGGFDDIHKRLLEIL
jgi:UDP-N-acetylmuramate: L-alanyl-gamma-D-glutamyl-meso-diaminopimelate ligase